MDHPPRTAAVRGFFICSFNDIRLSAPLFAAVSSLPVYSGAFMDSTMEMRRSLPFMTRLTQREKKMVSTRENR